MDRLHKNVCAWCKIHLIPDMQLTWHTIQWMLWIIQIRNEYRFWVRRRKKTNLWTTKLQNNYKIGENIKRKYANVYICISEHHQYFILDIKVSSFRIFTVCKPILIAWFCCCWLWFGFSGIFFVLSIKCEYQFFIHYTINHIFSR